MNYCYYIFTPKGVNYFLQYLLYIMYNIGSVKLLYFAAFLISVSIFHTLLKLLGLVLGLYYDFKEIV